MDKDFWTKEELDELCTWESERRTLGITKETDYYD